jgi:hypothetical protein
LVNLLVSSVVLPTLANDVRSVFYISKSENGNQVHYGIKLNQNCLPANNRPVYVYWLMESGKTEGIVPVLETPAYGIGSQKVFGNNVNIVLNGLKNRGVEQIRLASSKSGGRCQVKAYTEINNVEKQFSRVHIDLVATKQNPLTRGALAGRIVQWTIFRSDGTREIIPCRSNCKFGI